MKIAHYAYDNVNNPRCGGGGAFRELTIHRHLAARHEILYYSGFFKGARPYSEPGIRYAFLGFGSQYLLSRITFALCATIHSLFVKADVIVIGYSVFSPVLTFLFRRRKTIIEFYHLTGNVPFKKYLIFGLLPWFAERLALLCGCYFITLTDSMAEYIRQKYRNKMVCAAYTGYDTAINNTGKKDGKYILCFGRIDIHMKGIDILLDAFEKIAPSFPAYSLRLAGRGAQRDIAWLEKRIQQSPVKGRIYRDYNVDQTEKYRLFHGATFLCMPSRFEGWCISAVEAAASSKATLGTQIMGLKDSICDGETGILVPAENSNLLAEKMALLLQDQSLRIRLGKNGYQWARNFTWERIARLQEEFYVRVAAGKALSL